MKKKKLQKSTVAGSAGLLIGLFVFFLIPLYQGMPMDFAMGLPTLIASIAFIAGVDDKQKPEKKEEEK